MALGLAGAAVGKYAQRVRSRGRVNWRPPGGRQVVTSSLAARVIGESGSPVVLLHGLVASGIFWGASYDALARQHRLVVPDLLGFGRSPRPTSGYGPDDHVRALLACLDDLGVTEPATIGAHSLGSLIAIRLAATHPDRVSGIVAFGPPLYRDRRSARAHVAGTGPMGPLFVLPGRTAQIACRWVCDHRALSAKLAELTHPGLPPAIAADGVQHSWDSYSETIDRMILANEAPTWLSQVRCPVRLVAGDRDRVADHKFLGQLPLIVDGVAVETWSGGHDLPLAWPRECAHAIAGAITPSEASGRPTR